MGFCGFYLWARLYIPHEEASDGKDAESGHEGYAETPFAQNPAGDGWRAEEVGTEVGSGETRRLGRSDV
jgi:hypothetical protein